MAGTPTDDLVERLKNPEYAKLYGAENAKVDFAITLTKARKSLNLTQKSLADKLGISQSYVAKLEGGEANPTLGRIGSLLATIGLRLTTGKRNIGGIKEMSTPIEFSECPICHSKDTVCRQACADEPSIPKGTFVSLDKVFTPIQDVNKITTPMVKGILCHFDICARCGTRYCTKAEITSVPVTIQHRSGSSIKGLGVPR